MWRAKKWKSKWMISVSKAIFEHFSFKFLTSYNKIINFVPNKGFLVDKETREQGDEGDSQLISCGIMCLKR